MKNSSFGDVIFNFGWEKKINIHLFDNEYNIVVQAEAYFEKDGISCEQEDAYVDFTDNKDARLKTVESLLCLIVSKDDEILSRFTPQLLLFKRNGDYALLFDDTEDEDCGIAVCLMPEPEIMAQDSYI